MTSITTSSDSYDTVYPEKFIPTDQSIREYYATGQLPASILKWIGYLFTFIYFYGALIHPEHPIWQYIGCSAFPIFAFFISEGYEHTHNKLRYGLQLWICGAVTQFPYYLCFHQLNPFFSWHTALNPVFTYFLGYILIWTLDIIRTEFRNQIGPKWILILLLCGTFGIIAHAFPFYHGAYGLAVVVLFWLLREDFWDSAFVNWILIMLYRTSEMWNLPGFLLLGGTYNHRRGKTPSWIFYLLFPILFFGIWGHLKGASI